MPRLFNVDELVNDDDDLDQTQKIKEQGEEERAKEFLSSNFITKSEFNILKRDIQNLKRSNGSADNGVVINTSEDVVEFVRRPRMIFSDKEDLKKNIVDYYWEADIFSLEECRNIRSIGEGLDFNFGTTENSDREKPETEVRNNDVSWIPINDETLWVYERINDVVYRANKETWNFNLTGFYEDIQYSIYEKKDEDPHYNWHMDIGSEYPMNYRKISVSIQLSSEDEYEDGELQLNQGISNINAIKDAGSGLIFPSYMLHRVMPITKGKRESIQIWVSGVPFQ